MRYTFQINISIGIISRIILHVNVYLREKTVVYLVIGRYQKSSFRFAQSLTLKKKLVCQRVVKDTDRQRMQITKLMTTNLHTFCYASWTAVSCPELPSFRKWPGIEPKDLYIHVEFALRNRTKQKNKSNCTSFLSIRQLPTFVLGRPGYLVNAQERGQSTRHIGFDDTSLVISCPTQNFFPPPPHSFYGPPLNLDELNWDLGGFINYSYLILYWIFVRIV